MISAVSEQVVLLSKKQGPRFQRAVARAAYDYTYDAADDGRIGHSSIQAAPEKSVYRVLIRSGAMLLGSQKVGNLGTGELGRHFCSSG